MPLKKAVGERGSWFASVDGERLPCVHEYHFKGGRYYAPNCAKADPKHVELIDSIQGIKKVILTTDNVVGDGAGFERTGYVAVFRVEDVVWENDLLEFRFIERLQNLK